MRGRPRYEARLDSAARWPRRRSRIPGRTAAMLLATPIRLTRTVSAKASASKSTADVSRPTPAPAISRSVGPSCASSRPTDSRTAAASVTSATAAAHRPPALFSSDSRAARPSADRSSAATRAPSAERRRASSRPMPPAAPVISATRSAKECMAAPRRRSEVFLFLAITRRDVMQLRDRRISAAAPHAPDLTSRPARPTYIVWRGRSRLPRRSAPPRSRRRRLMYFSRNPGRPPPRTCSPSRDDLGLF